MNCSTKFERSDLKITPYIGQVRFWKYNGKSVFLLFSILTDTLRKNISNSNYIALYEKTAFENDFGPRGVPKPENAIDPPLLANLLGLCYTKTICSKIGPTYLHFYECIPPLLTNNNQLYTLNEYFQISFKMFCILIVLIVQIYPWLRYAWLSYVSNLILKFAYCHKFFWS